MSHICPSCWTDHYPRSYLTNLPPVSSHNIEQMRETLEPFLNQPPNTLREAVVLCPESISMAVRHEMQWPFSKKTRLYALTTRRHLPKLLLHDVGAAAQKVQPAKRHIGPSTPQNLLTCHSSHRAAPGSSGIPILFVPSASFRVHQCARWHLDPCSRSLSHYSLIARPRSLSMNGNGLSFSHILFHLLIPLNRLVPSLSGFTPNRTATLTLFVSCSTSTGHMVPYPCIT